MGLSLDVIGLEGKNKNSPALAETGLLKQVADQK